MRVVFGEGEAKLDPDDGAVLALRHPRRPGAPWLLDEATEPWHTREHRWGSGFVISSCVSGRAAHRADPLANDRDWALYWPLLLGGLG